MVTCNWCNGEERVCVEAVYLESGKQCLKYEPCSCVESNEQWWNRKMYPYVLFDEAIRKKQLHMQELRFDALSLVDEERNRQVEKWGTQRLSWVEWVSILAEEVGEFAQQANEVHFDPTGCLDKEGLLLEVTQVAAVAVAIIEHLLEGDSSPTPHFLQDIGPRTKPQRIYRNGSWWEGGATAAPPTPNYPTTHELFTTAGTVRWTQ